MFNSKSTGIGLTTAVSILIAALIVILTALDGSRAFGCAFFLLAMACITVSIPALSRSPQTIGRVE